jgi:hypothetical protein
MQAFWIGPATAAPEIAERMTANAAASLKDFIVFCLVAGPGGAACSLPHRSFSATDNADSKKNFQYMA